MSKYSRFWTWFSTGGGADVMPSLDWKVQMVIVAAIMQSVDNRLEKAEEPVADFNHSRERGVGAIMPVSFFAASLSGLLVTFDKKIWAGIVGYFNFANICKVN